MSGLLRRIKRSRAADAGETPAEGQAAATEGAPTTAATAGGAGERPWASGERSTAELPAGAPPEAGAVPPPIQADPDVPAGLDPAEAAVQPPAGRRSRLRRRLRYLRRARELMLRDLGGLIFEVHRTAGGDVGAHAGVIGAKVQRLASVDAEAHAIETALAAPRGEAVVFEPGVGGTCDVCGELYGSDARFCSNCGSPTGSAVHVTDAGRPVPAMPKPPAAAADEAPEPEQTPQLDATAEPGKTPDQQATAERDATRELDATAERDDTREATAERDATRELDATAERDDTREATAGRDETRELDATPERDARNAFGDTRNGRDEDRQPPRLSSGDPLGARESRS